MKKGWLGGALLGLLIMAGCAGPEGPMGPVGPAGTSGVYLLAEYTNADTSGVATAGDYTVDVPQIINKRSTTFVEVYLAVPDTDNTWIPMADGYSATTQFSLVSWSLGKVYLNNLEVGDRYLIKIFEYDIQ